MPSNLLSIFMTLFQHDGSRQYGNVISYNEKYKSLVTGLLGQQLADNIISKSSRKKTSYRLG